MGINDVLNQKRNEVITNNFNKIKGKKRRLNNYIKDRSKVKVEYKDPFYKFPDPMLSTISNPLSPGYSPLNSDNNNLLSNDPNLKIVRNNGRQK